MRVHSACTLGGFSVTADVTGSVTRTMTIIKGTSPTTMADTAISVPMGGSASSAASGLTVALAAGDLIAIRDTASGANSVTVNFYWSMRCQ